MQSTRVRWPNEIRTRTHSGAIALTLVASAGATGCQLIGYEHLGQRVDAGELAVGPHDAEVASGVDATVSVDASDSSASSSADAHADSSSSGLPDASTDAGVLCSGAINACGGCSSLSSELNASCGLCGLGHYACDGTDSLVCKGAAPVPKAIGGTVVIDDFEDGDAVSKPGSGLDGYWTAYSDHTAGTLSQPDGGRITPEKGGAAGTARSARLMGGGFTGYGAGLILWPDVQQCTFDASPEQGVSFWLKGAGTVRFSVATTETLDTPGCGTTCNDFHQASFVLTPTWTHYTVPWSQLKQLGWGAPQPFVPSHVEYFQFSFGPKVNFDLYVDEITFF